VCMVTLGTQRLLSCFSTKARTCWQTRTTTAATSVTPSATEPPLRTLELPLQKLEHILRTDFKTPHTTRELCESAHQECR